MIPAGMVSRSERGKVVGVIPARGGSKGLPRKNLALLAGKSLLAWTVEAARASRSLDRLIVSTEDEEIAAAARALGVEVPFLRPASLAGDSTPMLPVLKHAAEELAREGAAAEALVVLQPTSPLRPPELIDAAVEKYLATGSVVISVRAVKDQPELMLRLEGDRLRPWQPSAHAPGRSSRQELPRRYAPNGAIYVVPVSALFRAEDLLAGEARAIIMDPISSLEVDSGEDLALLEAVVRGRAFG
jgi:CMP-N-acetylneuraminic acid synthetase